MDKPDYLVVQYSDWVPGYGYGSGLLINDVNKLIEEGYKPCGGLFVGKLTTSQEIQFIQAMYRDSQCKS